MQIIKKINNNVALAKDSKGTEVIVFGKGVGFPCTPYELTDLSVIQRTFYSVSSKYYDLIADMPIEILLAADDIANEAAEELDCILNSSLPFTLADHLKYAIERQEKGLVLENPLAYDVEHLYPQEYMIARSALHLIKHSLGIELPKMEIASIALHLITAEQENGNMHTTMMTSQIISDLTNIVETSLGMELNKESFSYSRFVMHLRYMVQRILKGKHQGMNDEGTLFRNICKEYPEAYQCVLKICEYFQNTWHWKCNQDEQLYLMVHIHRAQMEHLE